MSFDFSVIENFLLQIYMHFFYRSCPDFIRGIWLDILVARLYFPLQFRVNNSANFICTLITVCATKGKRKMRRNTDISDRAQPPLLSVINTRAFMGQSVLETFKKSSIKSNQTNETNYFPECSVHPKSRQLKRYELTVVRTTAEIVRLV